MTEADLSTKTKDFDTIGGRLGRARGAVELSIEKVAALVGVEEATLNSWECDQAEPRSNRLTMLAGVLGVSPSWLLFGRGTSPTEESEADTINALKTQIASLKSDHQKLGSTIDKMEETLAQLP